MDDKKEPTQGKLGLESRGRIEVKGLMEEMSLGCLRRVEESKSMAEQEVANNEMKEET